ncbi:glycosyltransferase [Geomonas sp. RF6]|uniref:glycosyltransferase n=1 Tax=Geomonas sp. RF6 TaxID=2897342 RepID=UPI001E34FA1D|nr:glycosyltransferase [Geomonas sp. RF6]UFS70591.1 glycosyltransferase [Geomonas sp. RF6]
MNTQKPLITFGLMAYNDSKFLREALAAAFSQSYEPLEIILSDDCSTDDTLQIMEQAAAEYRGPHTIVLNRNERNVGVSNHINRIMEICSGEIMVIAAADDISLPHRVQRTYEEFVASGGTAFSIHSSCILIDDNGETIGTAQEYESYEADLETVIEEGTWLYGCTHAWHRDIFDKFGPLRADVKREDEVLPFRSLLLGTIRYIREPLVLYRLHGSNLSKWKRTVVSDGGELNDLIYGEFHERVVNLKSYLADLETGGHLLDRQRMVALRERILREIDSREVEMTLRKGSLKEKVEILRQQNAVKFDPALTARVLLRILFPDLYKQYSYHRYKKFTSSEVEMLPDGGPARGTVPLQQ